MNYAGKFDATFASDGSSSTHSHHAYVHADSAQTRAPADALIVPDAQLLFHGDFSRSGADLVLTKDDRSFVLHDYFRGEKRAPLASRDGAHLTPDIVKALVGEVQVAQAGNAAAASQVIGHVTKLQGSATIIRNGVSVILNMGDNVEKGDVVESGASSSVGITFIDGTVFGLGANARMVLNEMVYEPNGSNNSSLLSLVAGTITFVAGETAKHGDMKVDTPVATMGIRGTAVLVEIDFSVVGQNGQPNASFQVLVEPDGTTGSYILFDKATLQPIAVVNQAGQQLNINNGIISQTTTPLSPDAQKLIGDVFQQKFTDNSQTAPKTTAPSNDSVTPQTGTPTKLANGSTATPVYQVTGTAPSSTPPPPPPQQVPTISHISGSLDLRSLGLAGPQTLFTTSEMAGKTGDIFDFETVGGRFVFKDINPGDQPTVSAEFASVTYTNGNGSFVIGAGQTVPPVGLNAQQFADISATAIKLFLVPDASNANNGTVTWLYSLRDNAFDFLAAGETLTFTYHVTLASNYQQGPEFKSIDITIQVTGTNDQPVITTGPRSIVFDPAGKLTAGGFLTSATATSGQLTFTDVDLTDTHKVSVALTKEVASWNGGTVPPLPESVFESAMHVSIKPADKGSDSTGTGTGAIAWTFDQIPVYLADFIPAGQTLTLTYTVTVTDALGLSSDQTITVTIAGNETPAVVWIHTTADNHNNLWSNAANWGTGSLPTSADDVIIITNQLQPNTPAYPATIDAKTQAAAHSVLMNDFAGLPPELDVSQGGSLTIVDGMSLNVDARFTNAGTVTVGGKLELLDSFDAKGNLTGLNQSIIVNSGALSVAQGGDILGSATGLGANGASAPRVLNTGTIDLTAGTLNVSVNIANTDGVTGGHFTVEQHAILSLGGDPNNPGVHGAITGGTLTIHGELDLLGADVLAGGSLFNDGHIDVGGAGNAFNNEIVTNTGTLQINDGAGLTLNGATIHGGTINDGTATGTNGQFGAIDVTGSSRIDSGAILNNGSVKIEQGVILTLDHVTVNGTSFVVDGLLPAVPGELVLQDGANLVGSQVIVDGGDQLILDNATLTGGSITNAGTLDNRSGNNLISGPVINTGTIEVETGTVLNLSGGVSGGGTMQVDVGGTLKLAGANAGTVAFNAGKSELVINGPATNAGAHTIQGFTGSIHGLVATDEIDLAAIGYSGATTATYDASSGVLTVSDANGDQYALNIGTGYGSAHFAGSGDDGGGTLITMRQADDAPAITPTSTLSGSFAELPATTGSPALHTVGGTINFTDVDLTDRPTVTIGTPAVFANGVDISASLTPAELTALQAALSLTAHAGNANNGAFDWTYSITDGALDFLSQGQQIVVTSTVTVTDNFSQTATSHISVTITGANDAPQVTSTSGPVSTNEGVPVTITGLSVADPDGGSSIEEITLSVSHGTLAFDGHAGSSITIDDTLANINAALANGVVYIPASNFAGPDTLNVSVNDEVVGAALTGSQQVGITVYATTGGNHVPVITSAAQTGAITEIAGVTGSPTPDTATGTITFTDADLADTHTVTVLGVAATGAAAGLPSQATMLAWLSLNNFIDVSAGAPAASQGWTFFALDKNFDYLGANQTVTLTYTVQVDDHHGGVVTTPVTITVTGTDDAPVITNTATGSVRDGGTFQVSGTLHASDPDLGDTQAWAIAGGASVASEPFNYGLHELTVTKTVNNVPNTIVFDDTFNGTAPPTPPAGSTLTYATQGGTIVPGNGSSPALLEGANASPVGLSIGSANYGQIVYGPFTTLLTGTSFNTTDPTVGLRSGTTFAASATFDLTNPADVSSHYGIRLSDRLNAGSPTDQPGTETVDLTVVHNADGTMSVVLNEINFETGISTRLQAMPLNPATGDNEIQLALANSASNNGHVVASFQLLKSDGAGHEIADGAPVTFASTGQIFDNENWTRAQVYGVALAQADVAPNVTANAVSFLQGTYGALAVNESTGAWNYYLNPSLVSTKALAAGQTAHDIFQVSVTDSAGMKATAPVDITVTGINDAPQVAFLPNHLVFDGNTVASGAVSTANVGNGSDGITLQGWVDWNGQGNTGAPQLLFYNGSTSDAGFGVNGVVTADGKLDLQIQHGGIAGVDTGIKIGANEWHNIALTHVNGLFVLYVDGEVAFTSTATVNPVAGSHYNDFTLIGGAVHEDGTFGGEGFTGSIAGVSVWNTALAQPQVQANQTATLTGSETGLVSYFPLSDGSGTAVSDRVIGGPALTIHGTANWVGGGASNVQSTHENTSVTINGLSVSDPDGGSSVEQITLSVSHGTISFNGQPPASSVTISGTLATINAALASGVVYTPASGYSGSDSLNVLVNDQVAGNPLTGSLAVAINVQSSGLDHWINGSGGDFATPGNWSTGAVPGASDDAAIDATPAAPGSTYVVNLSANAQVNSLTLAAGASLNMASGVTLTAAKNIEVAGLLNGAGGNTVHAGSLTVDGFVLGSPSPSGSIGVTAGTLLIDAAQFTNNGIVLTGGGATLDIGAPGGSDVITNLSPDASHPGGLVLSGGSYAMIDSQAGAGGTIALASGSGITTLNANVFLGGGASMIYAGGAALKDTLLTIGSAGNLSLNANFNTPSDVANFVVSHSVDVLGSIMLGGGTFDAAALTVEPGGRVSGSGLLSTLQGGIIGQLTNNGTIEALGQPAPGTGGQTLEIDAKIQGAGTLQIGIVPNVLSALQIDPTQMAMVNGLSQSVVSVSGQTIQFLQNIAPTPGSTQELIVGGAEVDSSTFNAAITGFVLGDSIDLTGIGTADGWSFNGSTLTLLHGSTTIGTLSFSGLASNNEFKVASDGHTGTLITENPTVTFTVLIPSGLDLSHQDLLADMGKGTVQPGDSSSFTVVDSVDGLQFHIFGSNLTYSGTTVTGGTITSFQELTTAATPVPLANFTGISVDAATWMLDVQQEAIGNKTPINTLLSAYAFNFIGGPGNDNVGLPPAPAGSHDTLTGGAGSDTFEFQKGDGAVVITDFDQGNYGHYDVTEHDKLVFSGFSGQPTFGHDVNGNLTADFGNGDVLTLVGITDQNQVPQADITFNSGGSGGGNGPVIGGANNSVIYQGTPVLIDPSVLLTDAVATVASVNVWISAGSQAGDQLTIYGMTDGTIQNGDGSIIGYHFDNTPGANGGQGPGIFLSNLGTTPATTADFQAALQLIKYSSTGSNPTASGTDNSRTITWAAYDNINHSPTVTTTINLAIVPILNSFTLTVSKGGTTLLTNSDFSVTDPGHSSFTYSVSLPTGGQFEVFNGSNWVSAPTGGFTTAQIAAGQVEFVQDGTSTIPSFQIWASDGPGGSNAGPAIAPTINLTDKNYAWNVVDYPAVVQGEHVFGSIPQFSMVGGVIALAYGGTQNYSPTASSLTMTRFVKVLDPFFLPGQHAVQTINSTVVSVPARYNFVMPTINVSGVQTPEGIFVYKGQANPDGTGGNALWQIIGTGDSNGDGGVTLGAPTLIGTPATTVNTIYNLTESYKNVSGLATSYDIAWDQYNGGSYNLEIQITPIDPTTGSFGTPVLFSPAITETGATSVSVADIAHMPAWNFRAVGSSTTNAVYALAIAESDTQLMSGATIAGQVHDAIYIQGYAVDGTIAQPLTVGGAGLSFFIQPNLTAYAAGATNHIDWQTIPSLSSTPGQTVQALQFVQVSAANGGRYAVAWNETVVDTNGTHDQVEFVLTGVYRATFQIPDGHGAQSVRISEFSDPATAGKDDVVVVFGDDTGTHILEYGVTTTSGVTSVAQLASFTDPTTQAFSNLSSTGDGRITVTYNERVNPLPDQTSQYVFKTFDLRTAGLNINASMHTDGLNQYFAGTHYTDTIVGENNVGNQYYFVGQNSSGIAPVDHFTGGSGNMNIAIFSDARSDYTFTTDGSGVTTVASNGANPEHNGSLVVSNVQVLAFAPTVDPTPHNGTVDVNGGTDMILGGISAITIEAGATAEISTAAPYTGSVTFGGATGTLVLDQPASFSGTIAGITGPGDVLDLIGLNAATTTATSAGGYNSSSTTTTLTVTDTSQPIGQQSKTFTLAGNLSTSIWTVADDHHGGVTIVDPPVTTGGPVPGVIMHDPGPVTDIVANVPNQTLTGTGSANNFVFNVNFGKDAITNYTPGVDSITLDHTAFSANVNALLAATQDDGSGNTVITVDANDTITLQHVLKAQLATHLSDFHFA